MRSLGYFFATVSRKIWKHSVSGAGMTRKTQVPAFGQTAIQIDIFTNELAGDLWPDTNGCPARSRAVHPAEARFVGEHDAQAATTPGGSQPGFPDSIRKP